MDKLIEKIGNQQIVDISEKHKDNEENRLNLIPFARELLEYAIPIISEEIKKELERYGWFPDASGGHDPEWLARRNAWDNYWRKFESPSGVEEKNEMRITDAMEQLIKMSKIMCERIDEGLALGEKLDISPFRQAIFDAENALEGNDEI